MMTSDTLAHSAAMVKALGRVLRAQVVETHISWVLLGAETAYKIKKPVRLPFVDYSTAEARRHFCEEEVRLNRRLAAPLYLGVSRITGTSRTPSLDGPGPTLDHAVRMKRFADGALFCERLDAGLLEAAQVDALAQLLAGFHASAPMADAGNGLATPQRRKGSALAALEGASAIATPHEHDELGGWIETQSAALAPLWKARRAAGFVRECHGDLHLGNILVHEGGVLAFDCIEFDAALRWIDVIDDIAFPVMDFASRGRADFAWALLNGWLDRTGDHGSLAALRFAAVYRALVRSQVERLRGQGRAAQSRRYLEAALQWMMPAAPRLVITHGLPGSGKTFQSQRMLETEGAVRLRSDVERKRLFGLSMLDDSRSRGMDLYTQEATALTYAHLFATARSILAAGFPVIIDAAFLRRSERGAAHALAQELGVPFAILDCDAPPEVLRERLLARQGDASEAGVAVLERLRASAQALGAEERAHVRDKNMRDT